MIICSGNSALARVQAKLMYQRKPRVKQFKRRGAFLFFLCCHLRVTKGFPNSLVGKQSACNAGDLGSVPGLGRSPGEGKGYPVQYSGLENSMDCRVHRVTKSQTRLSNFHFQFHAAGSWAWSLGVAFYEEWHKSVGAGRVLSEDLGHSVIIMTLEKEMATTPVFLPGESQGWESLVGCRLWGCVESDTTEAA